MVHTHNENGYAPSDLRSLGAHTQGYSSTPTPLLMVCDFDTLPSESSLVLDYAIENLYKGVRPIVSRGEAWWNLLRMRRE